MAPNAGCMMQQRLDRVVEAHLVDAADDGGGVLDAVFVVKPDDIDLGLKRFSGTVPRDAVEPCSSRR
ncbi:Protein of unknown function [Gryllus bimaculatus]|nr:Protein of unknown function [Gryllus bimaculatus]